jgi:hypothetical protein
MPENYATDFPASGTVRKMNAEILLFEANARHSMCLLQRIAASQLYYTTWF